MGIEHRPGQTAGEIMGPMSAVPSLMVATMPLGRIVMPIAIVGTLVAWLLGSLVSGGVDVLVVLAFVALLGLRLARRRAR